MITYQGRQFADWKAARASMMEAPAAPPAPVFGRYLFQPLGKGFYESAGIAPPMNTPEGHSRIIDEWNRRDRAKGTWKWDEIHPNDFDYPKPKAPPVAHAPPPTTDGPIVHQTPPAPAPAPPTPRPGSLAERYRPRRLADVVGQPDAVAALGAFVANPYPTAFILAGETGTGKSSAAIALAAELGCNIDAEPKEFGGVYSIPSGEHNADVLRALWAGLWTIPFQSERGWKVVIVNEVEQLNGSVERLWLDKLEDLPPSTVIVFTTNDLAHLPARFVDRCIGGVIEFRGAADDLGEPARTLARTIWRKETGGEIAPDVLDSVIQRSTKAGRLSLRRVVQALVPLVGAKGQATHG